MKLFHFLSPLVLLAIGCLPKKEPFPFLLPEPPEKWTAEANVSQEAEKVVYWAEGLDANLTSLLREAVANNPDLAGAARRVEMARERAVMAGASRMPQAGAALSGSRSKRNLVGFLPDRDLSFTAENYGLNLNVSWEIDLWGGLRDRRNAAEGEWRASGEDYRAARLSLAGQVAKAWYSAVEASLQVKLAEDTERTRARNAAYLAERFERGLAETLDHNLAKTSLASAQANVARRKRQRDLALRTLEALLGRHPAANLKLPPALPSPTDLPTLHPPATTLENRPDLRAARLRLRAAGHEESATRKNLLPSLSLSAGPGGRSQEFEDLLDQRFRIWSAAGNLTQPLLQGGRLRADLRRVQAARAAAAAAYKSAALAAFLEAESALAAEKFLREEEFSLVDATEAAETAAGLSWDRYRRGLENVFATLEADRRHFETESLLLSTRRTRLLNRVDLQLAMGREALPEPEKQGEKTPNIEP